MNERSMTNGIISRLGLKVPEVENKSTEKMISRLKMILPEEIEITYNISLADVSFCSSEDPENKFYWEPRLQITMRGDIYNKKTESLKSTFRIVDIIKLKDDTFTHGEQFVLESRFNRGFLNMIFLGETNTSHPQYPITSLEDILAG